MLWSKPAITAVTELLKPEHFYRPNHGEMYKAIVHLVNEGEPADPLTLARELEKRGLLRRIGAPYLHECMHNVPTALNAKYYAQIVYDRYRLRQVIGAGQRFIELGHTEATTTEEVDEVIARADEFFRELGEPTRQGLMWDDLVKKWRDWQQTKGGVVYTPWPELNAKLPGGGFHPGQLVIVGGRPAHGKSNAGLNIVLEAAEHNVPSTVFSVEMDDVEVASRLLAAGSWTEVKQIFAKKMDEETEERVEQYIEEHKGMPLDVVDQAYITVEQIVAHCRKRRPKIIFVDYAQLIEATNNKVLREQQVAHITRSLKVAAKHLGMVVIVASQLKRPSMPKRPEEGEGLPSISDLRESGAAEQDADIVLLLHRVGESPKIMMIVGKNRNGPTGRVPLTFRGNMARVG